MIELVLPSQVMDSLASSIRSWSPDEDMSFVLVKRVDLEGGDIRYIGLGGILLGPDEALRSPAHVEHACARHARAGA